MPDSVAAIKFLASSQKVDLSEVNVVFGDENYLKRRVVKELIAKNASGEDAQFGLSRIDSSTVVWRDVVDELATLSLFGGDRRTVVLEDADNFVSDNRGAIEDYIKQPATEGVLILVVQKWPKNTRLYKLLDKTGFQIDCKQPSQQQITSWLQSEAKSRYELNLSSSAAGQFVEAVGSEMGLLDQELAKLALVTDATQSLSPQQVRDIVGGWRVKTVWDMLDAACDGDTSEAMNQLERLIHAGEHPVAILGQIASSLRRFASAASIYRDAEKQRQRMSLRNALEAAGFKHYFVNDAQRRLKRLGRNRAAKLYHWLLAADLAMKGSSSAPDRARLVLEQLLVKVAAPVDEIGDHSSPVPSLARLG
ncbi:MAG: DNA polymerase III subunit delta [Planctomycetales bacterium]